MSVKSFLYSWHRVFFTVFVSSSKASRFVLRFGMRVSLLRSVCIRYRQKRSCTIGPTFPMASYSQWKYFLFYHPKVCKKGVLHAYMARTFASSAAETGLRVDLWVSIPGIIERSVQMFLYDKRLVRFKIHLLCCFVRYCDTNIVIINYAGRPLAFSSTPSDGASFSGRIILFRGAGHRSLRRFFRIRPYLPGGFVSVPDKVTAGIRNRRSACRWDDCSW